MKVDRLLLAVAGVAAASSALLPSPPAAGQRTVRWPATFEGRVLTPLRPAPEDARLSRGFPGRIARFSDGRRQIVLRSVAAATRQLHPARDCFGAIGYRIEPLPMVRSSSGLGSCFKADRDGVAVRVCERIVAADGTSFPDVSSWYWPALLGRSRGPWLAVTSVERLGGENP